MFKVLIVIWKPRKQVRNILLHSNQIFQYSLNILGEIENIRQVCLSSRHENGMCTCDFALYLNEAIIYTSHSYTIQKPRKYFPLRNILYCIQTNKTSLHLGLLVKKYCQTSRITIFHRKMSKRLVTFAENFREANCVARNCVMLCSFIKF